MESESENIRYFGITSVAVREAILALYKRDHGASYRAMQAQVDAGKRFYRVSNTQRGLVYEIALDCVDDLGIGPRLGSITTKSGIPH